MSTTTLDIDEQGIAVLKFNRPERLNSITIDLLVELKQHCHELAQSHKVKALVVSGVGRAFCAGADLAATADNTSEFKVEQIGDLIADHMARYFNPTMEALYQFPKPVVTAINGIAAGGGVGLALCADIVIASDNASLKVVQAQQLGIAADLGSSWLLHRTCGRNRAMAMCLLGETIKAEQMRSFGLAWKVTSGEGLIAEAKQIAAKLASIPNKTLLQSRGLVDNAAEQTFSEALEAERLVQQGLCSEPVFIDSIKAFLQ